MNDAPWPDEMPTRFQIGACASQHSWHRPCVHVINEIARLESALSATAEAVDRLMAREGELESALAANRETCRQQQAALHEEIAEREKAVAAKEKAEREREHPACVCETCREHRMDPEEPNLEEP